jgi:hypothetical protein
MVVTVPVIPKKRMYEYVCDSEMVIELELFESGKDKLH